MPAFSYLTIQTSAEGFYKEMGSKFMAFAYPVQSESEIKEKLEALKKKFYDASHHCFAWMLGSEYDRFRAFDDGEPNHTAGDPILGQIRSRQLTNVLIVVVRYFGGTKLGVGGLIQAYKLAAEAALNTATIIERNVEVLYFLTFPYGETPELMKLFKDCQARQSDQYYGEACGIKVAINLSIQNEFERRLKLLQAMGSTLTFAETPNSLT